MFTALFKAIAQLTDPRLKRVALFGVLGAFALHATLAAGAWWLLENTHWFATAWVDSASRFAVGLAATLLPLPFFPALATAVMSLMLEKVADAVEERHYPHLSPPRPQKMTEVVGATLRFLWVTLLVNLIALPFYIILVFTGLTVVLAALVNGYLLGREYFELVAFRHMEPAQARVLFRNRVGYVWLGGTVIALLFSLPVINLLAPVIGAAMMVHIFHSLNQSAKG